MTAKRSELDLQSVLRYRISTSRCINGEVHIDGLGSDGRHELQIVRAETGVLSDARKHLGADFFAVVKRENKVRPSIARQSPMGP